MLRKEDLKDISSTLTDFEDQIQLLEYNLKNNSSFDHSSFQAQIETNNKTHKKL